MAVKQILIDTRKNMGLTQAQVASEAELSRGAYTAIERGLRCPSLETAIRICDVLKIPVEKAFPITDYKSKKGSKCK